MTIPSRRRLLGIGLGLREGPRLADQRTVRGSPEEIAASTSTMEPCIPTNATDHALAPVTGCLAHE